MGVCRRNAGPAVLDGGHTGRSSGFIGLLRARAIEVDAPSARLPPWGCCAHPAMVTPVSASESPLLAPPPVPIDAADDPSFWARHVRIAIVLYALCNPMLWAYAALTPDRPHRGMLIAMGLSGQVVAVVIDLLRHRVVASPHRMLVLYAWSTSTFAVIALGIYVDGGVRSPLTLLLLVSVGYVGLAYPPGAVLAFGTFGVLCIAAFGARDLTDSVHAPAALVKLSLTAAFSVLVTMAARNQWQSRAALAGLTARLQQMALLDHITA